jgi:excinuclease ABC subunit C
MTVSSLESIPGIGSTTIEKLFRRFKSMEGISNASLEELSSEVGLSRASKILEQMRVNKE